MKKINKTIMDMNMQLNGLTNSFHDDDNQILQSATEEQKYAINCVLKHLCNELGLQYGKVTVTIKR